MTNYGNKKFTILLTNSITSFGFFINKFKQKNENNINLLLNHLAVVYMFFVPLSSNGYAVDFLFTLMYLLIFIRGHYLKYIKISLSHPVAIAFLLFMLVFYIWLLGTSDTDFANRTLKYSHYLLYPFFFFLFLDQRFYSRMLSSFIGGVMLSEFISYLMQFHLIPWGFTLTNIQLPWNEIGHLFKIVFYSAINDEPAPFLEHSWYSVLLATTASILFYKAFSSQTILLRTINIIFFTTLSINLFFIGGRTGYILYIILLCVNIFILFKEPKFRKPLLFIFLIPIVIVIFMYQMNGIFTKRIDESTNDLNRIHAHTYNMDTSFGQRLLLAKSGLEIIPDNFFFGVGTGDQLSILRAKPENENNPIQIVRDVHNQYIDLFMQFGLIGFLFYLNIFYRTAKFHALDEERNHLKLLVLTAMIYTGFLGSFWCFLPVLFTTLIIITTANKDIISTKISKVTVKTILFYSVMILLSYTIEKLQ